MSNTRNTRNSTFTITCTKCLSNTSGRGARPKFPEGYKYTCATCREVPCSSCKTRSVMSIRYTGPAEKYKCIPCIKSENTRIACGKCNASVRKGNYNGPLTAFLCRDCLYQTAPCTGCEKISIVPRNYKRSLDRFLCRGCISAHTKTCDSCSTSFYSHLTDLDTYHCRPCRDAYNRLNYGGPTNVEERSHQVNIPLDLASFPELPSTSPLPTPETSPNVSPIPTPNKTPRFTKGMSWADADD